MKKAIIFIGLGLIASTNGNFLQDPTVAIADSKSDTTATAVAFKGATATANASGSADAVAKATDGSVAKSSADNNVDSVAVAQNGGVAKSNAIGASDSTAIAKDNSIAIAKSSDNSSATSFASNKDVAVANSNSSSDALAIAKDNSYAKVDAKDYVDSSAYTNGGVANVNTSYDNCDDVRTETCDEVPFNQTPSISQAINGSECNNDQIVNIPNNGNNGCDNNNVGTPINITPIVSRPGNNDYGCETTSAPVVTKTNNGVDIEKRVRVDDNTALKVDNSADVHTAAVNAATKEAFNNKAISLTNFDANNASNSQYAGTDSNEINISKKHADSKVYADKNNNLCHAKRIFAEKCDRNSKEKLDDVHDCYDHANKNKVCTSECSKDLETSNTDSCGCKTAKCSTWKQKKQETIHCDTDKGRDDEVHAFKDCQNDYKQYQNVEVKKVHDDDLVKQTNCRQNDYFNQDRDISVKQNNAQSSSTDLTKLNSIANQGSLASSFAASDEDKNSSNALAFNNQKSVSAENLLNAYNNQGTGDSC